MLAKEMAKHLELDTFLIQYGLSRPNARACAPSRLAPSRRPVQTRSHCAPPRLAPSSRWAVAQRTAPLAANAASTAETLAAEAAGVDAAAGSHRRRQRWHAAWKALPAIVLVALIAGGGVATSILSLWVRPDGVAPLDWLVAVGTGLVVSLLIIEPCLAARAHLRRTHRDLQRYQRDRSAEAERAQAERRAERDEVMARRLTRMGAAAYAEEATEAHRARERSREAARAEAAHHATKRRTLAIGSALALPALPAPSSAPHAPADAAAEELAMDVRSPLTAVNMNAVSQRIPRRRGGESSHSYHSRRSDQSSRYSDDESSRSYHSRHSDQSSRYSDDESFGASSHDCSNDAYSQYSCSQYSGSQYSGSQYDGSQYDGRSRPGRAGGSAGGSNGSERRRRLDFAGSADSHSSHSSHISHSSPPFPGMHSRHQRGRHESRGRRHYSTDSSIADDSLGA